MWDFVPGVPGGPGSATRIIFITHFLYVWVSLYNPLSTGGRLGVHKTFRRRSVTTCGRLLRFQVRPV